MILSIGIISPSCNLFSTQREIVYARATKLPIEASGFMRIATDDPILVDIVGTSIVAEKVLAGYLVIHEQDLAQLIKNTEELLNARVNRK